LTFGWVAQKNDHPVFAIINFLPIALILNYWITEKESGGKELHLLKANIKKSKTKFKLFFQFLLKETFTIIKNSFV